MPNMYGLRRDDSVILSIDRDETKIGRHTSNNIVINALPVSRYHSTIVRLDKKYFINDKNTANGTFIGKYQIPPNRETRLKVGDRIGFGLPAGENSKCTFEVVYIQLDNINNVPPPHEELPGVVGSSTDCDLILSEIHHEIKPEIEVVEPANMSEERESEVTIVNTFTSNEKENSVQRSTESSDCSEIFMMPSRCETKIESSDSSINDLTLCDNENPESKIITIDLCQEESMIDLCDDVEEITMVQEEVSTINCEIDVKPFEPLFVPGVQYSTLDEITILDSDEEDFLSSQSSTTCIEDDFSNSLESMFNEEKLDGLETSRSSHYPDLNWYESGKKELKIDLPIQNQVSPRKKKQRAHSESLKEQAKPHKRHLSKEQVKNEDSDAKCSRSKRPLIDDTVPEKQLNRRSSTSMVAKEILKSMPNDCLPRVVVQDFLKPKQTSDSKKRTKSNEKSDDKEVFRFLMKKNKPGPRSKTMRFMLSTSPKHKKTGKKQSGPVDKEQLKEIRKEKLKQITLKNESLATNSKAENAKRVVVAKCTKENRSDKMYMTNETTNSTELTSSMATIMYTDIVVAPEYEERSKETHGYASLYDDALDISSQIPDESIESNSPSKRIAHTHMTEEFVQSGTDKQSHTRLNEEAAPISEVDGCQKQYATEGRSPTLEMNFYTERQEKVTKKKRVHFSEGKVDYQVLNIDPEERRATGHTSKCKKENLKKLDELDSAIAHACGWKVNWLKEQEEMMAPPPDIYVKEDPCLEKPDKRLLLEYRAKLKDQLFHHLWNAVWRSHNTPNHNYLPNTQSVIDGKRGVYTLYVESVQLQNINRKSPPLRIITAYRDIDNMESDQLTSGHMVILSLRVKQAERESKVSRANIFAYVAYAHQILDKDGESRQQRVIFKTFPRNCEIVIGEIKVKVLSHARLLLKRFEAFALVKQRSPLIDFLSSQRSEPVSLPVVNTEEQTFVDNAYLNESQKSAIITCLNSISSSEPSVCVVDGLPGTGKSQVIVSLMIEMFSETRLGQLPTDLKVLIITKNNKLADDLAQRLVRRTKGLTSMNVLRYGREIWNTKVKYCSVEDRVQERIKEDKGNPLIDLDEEIRITRAKIESYKLNLESEHLTEEQRVKAKWKLNTHERLLKDLLSAGPNRTKDQLLERAAKNEVFQNAKVVVTSSAECWSSTSHFEHDFVLLDHNRSDGGDLPEFNVCIFDDANYADEAQMLVPILLRVQNLVLVGDSRNHYYSECGEWPFCRLVNDFKKNGSNALIPLGYQHRMQPGVAAFRWLDKRYTLPCLIKPRSSPLIPFLMVDLQIDNSTSLNYSVKRTKQADFCCRLLTKINFFESDVPIAIIVVTNEEKRVLEQMIANYVRGRGDQPPIYVCTLNEVIGRDYEIVIACFPTKSSPMDKWLYLVSSRARSHLFMCGYFGDDSMKNDKDLLWLTAEAVLRKMCVKWKVDDDFPAEYLRKRQPLAN